MAQIKKFVPKKDSPFSTENDASFEEKIKQHRQKRFLQIVALIVVAIVVGSALYTYLKNITYNTYIVTSTVEKNMVTGSRYVNYAGNILSYSKDGVFSMDSKGNSIWNETYEMQNPILRISGKMVAVADYDGHYVFIMDEHGMKGKIDTNLPIRDLAVSENGIIATILEDTRITNINLYNQEGTMLVTSELRMQQTGYPMALDLSNDGNLLLVSYFGVDGSDVKSSIVFYNYSDVGQNNVDRLVGASDYRDVVMPVVGFLGKGSAYAVGDKRLSFYSGEEKPVSISEIILEEEILGVYEGDTSVGLLVGDLQEGNKYRLDVYDGKGNRVASQKIDMEFKDIIIRNDTILIYNETQMELFTFSGKEKYNNQFQERINLLIPGSNIRKYTMVTDNSISTIELR